MSFLGCATLGAPAIFTESRQKAQFVTSEMLFKENIYFLNGAMTSRQSELTLIWFKNVPLIKFNFSEKVTKICAIFLKVLTFAL
jgi:hypothetical protein